MSLGPMEIIIILVIVLLLFGGKKLPELARGLGKGISEFKKASNEVKEEIKTANQKENLLTPEERVLLSDFINKIQKELSLGKTQ